MTLLNAQNLKKTFDNIVAVEDISLSLEVGEVVGFSVGANSSYSAYPYTVPRI